MVTVVTVAWLSDFGLTYCPVEKDGNCFFMSIALNSMTDSGKWAETLVCTKFHYS